MSLLRDTINSILEPFVLPAFHHIYYDSGAWRQNRFLGYRIQQWPLDLQLYQELVFRTRPSFIIQTGVEGGGSVLYFASLLDLIGAPPDAVVIGVDIRMHREVGSLRHPRIRLIEGDSVSTAVHEKIRALLPKPGGMVVLDSDHSERHVTAELGLYSDYVAPGNYLVVEDTNVGGHPVFRSHGPGPYEAVSTFLQKKAAVFQVDPLWKRNKISFHHWLRRSDPNSNSHPAPPRYGGDSLTARHYPGSGRSGRDVSSGG